MIRTIEFTVDEQSVTPAVRQFAGVAGEHNATKVIFTVENGLFENIKKKAENGKELYYRFDCFDASGALYSTVPEKITDLPSTFSASILLGENITRLGGEAKIVLVVTLLNAESKTEMELLSVPVSVYFKGVPFASGKLDESRESLTSLEQSAKNAARNAEGSAENAESNAMAASGSALSAAASANAAQTYANGADESAGKAQKSADDAAGYAGEATKAFEDAQAAANSASDYAEAAAESAGQAAKEAQTAAEQKLDTHNTDPEAHLNKTLNISGVLEGDVEINYRLNTGVYILRAGASVSFVLRGEMTENGQLTTVVSRAFTVESDTYMQVYDIRQSTGIYPYYLPYKHFVIVGSTKKVQNNETESYIRHYVITPTYHKELTTGNVDGTETVIPAHYTDSLEDRTDTYYVTRAYVDETTKGKVNLPTDTEGNIQNGTSGQVLQTNGDGTTEWVDMTGGGSGGTVDNAELKKVTANMQFLNMGNLINLETINENLLLSNGGISFDSRFCHTDFIPVIAGSTLNFKVYKDNPALGKIRYLAAYDANKTVLSNLGITASKDFYTVPEGVSYIKASIRVEDIEYAVLINGTLPDEYILYSGNTYFATEDFVKFATYTKSQTDEKFEKIDKKLSFDIQTGIAPNIPIPITYEQGGIDGTTGLDTTSERDYFVRSVGFIAVKYGDEIKFNRVEGNPSFRLYKYSTDGTFIGRTDMFWFDTTFKVIEDCCYRIQVQKNSGTITPDDVIGFFTITTAGYNRNGLANLNGEYVKEADDVIEEVLDETSHLRLLCFADPHDFSAYKYLKYNEIMSRGVIDYLVGLGDYVDYVNRGTDKSAYRKLLLESINRAGRDANHIYVTGNHDASMKPGGAAGTSDINLILRPMECFDVFYRHLKTKGNIVVDPENPYGCYFYMDDTQSKTRLIILNSNEIFNVEGEGTVTWYFEQTRMSQQQLDWFSKTALHVDEDGWSVMIFLHNITPYRGNYILFRILAAAKAGTAINETFTAYDRMILDDKGNATSEIDTVNGDTYTVDVDYSNEEHHIDVIAIVHGHSHMSDDNVVSGIRRIQVRTDNAGLDDFYHCDCTIIPNTTYYFTDVKGHIYTYISASTINTENVAKFGYNAYLTQYGREQTIAHLYDSNGRIVSNINIKATSTIPTGATELVGFVRERDDTLAGNESCEIFCINKNTRTVTTIPYGTGTKRVIPY